MSKSTLIKFSPTIMLVLAGNLFSIIGVMYFEWSVGVLLIAYWLETVVIAFACIPRIFIAKGSFFGKIKLTAYHSFIFGLLSLIYFTILDLRASSADFKYFETSNNFHWILGGFILIHSFDLVRDYYKTPFSDAALKYNLLIPFGRLIVLHFVLALGAKWFVPYGIFDAYIYILVVFKIVMDLCLYWLNAVVMLSDKDDNPY